MVKEMQEAGAACPSGVHHSTAPFPYERRRSRRASMELNASLRLGPVWCAATTRNISEDGALLRILVPLRRGRQVRLRLHTIEGPLCVTAEVIWTRFPHAGTRFVDLSPQQRRALRSMVGVWFQAQQLRQRLPVPSGSESDSTP